MFKKKYYLIYPVQGDISTARSFKVKGDFIEFELINYKSCKFIKKEFLHKSFIHKVVEYKNWEDFNQDIESLITAITSTNNNVSSTRINRDIDKKMSLRNTQERNN